MPQLRVGCPTQVAEVALSQQRLETERRAGRIDHGAGRLHGPFVVAGHDVLDGCGGQTTSQGTRLPEAALAERCVGHLEDARGVAGRLAVPDQEDPTHRAHCVWPVSAVPAVSSEAASPGSTAPLPAP